MANEKHYLDKSGLTLYDQLIKSYITGKTNSVHQEVVALSAVTANKADKATTLSGYGITDASIVDLTTAYTVTLGNKAIDVYSTDQIDDTHKAIVKALWENDADIKTVSAMTITASGKVTQLSASTVAIDGRVTAVEGKVTTLSASTVNGLNDRYTKDEADNKFQVLSDLTTAITSASTNVQYPSAKAVYDAIDSATSGLEPRVKAIEDIIPSEATTANTLADKDFVNSSIATETATFQGTYRLVQDLHLEVKDAEDETVVGTAIKIVVTSTTVNNNDYVFVIIPQHDKTESGETVHYDSRYDRYKYSVPKDSTTGGTWYYEYSLNNSTFTAAQWKAINSGINSTKVSNYDKHIVNNDIHVTTAQTKTWNDYATTKADKATTLSGYGITDAKITASTTGSTITLGTNAVEVYSATQVDEKINSIQSITEEEIRELFD